MNDMKNDLSSQGIRLNNYSIGNHKTTCPRCSASRKNKKDPCLSVTVKDGDKALWNCHHCFWDGAAGNVSHGSRDEQKPKVYVKPEKPAVEALRPEIADYIKGRGITMQVCIRNKIYFDEKKNAIAFPYYVNNELTNIKYRTLDKRFSMVKDAKLTFYGLDDIRPSWKLSEELTKEIIVVEGEFDKLALEVCGLKNVLSVPNGAPARKKEDAEPDNTGAFAYMAHAENLFKEATRVILAVDDDAAGENLRFELARRIGTAKCFIAKFSNKDANGCLKEFGVDLTLECLRDASPYPIAGLYSVDVMNDDLIKFYNEGMCAGVSTGFENLDKIYTVTRGEVTGITGIPNSGKSEFADALMINLAKFENWQWCVFSPEGVKEQHIAFLIEKIVGAPSAPTAPNRMSLEQFMNGAAWVAKYFYFIRADDEAALPNLDYILEKASAAVYRYGIKGFLLDPWNELEHCRPATITEGEYVGQALARICRWAKNHMAAVFIVAHPTKISADKDGKTRVPGLYDILGSSNWANKLDNGIVIHRSEDAADTTEVYVKKVRSKFVGRRGICSLKYDRATGRYSVPPNYEKYANVKSEDEDMQTWAV